MHSYHREATVGGIVLLGVLIFLGGGLWLSGKSWNKAGLVPVYYQNIGNLKQGAPVRISGAPVGRVEEIRYVDVGRVLVNLKIDRNKVTPTTTATATIQSVGMLGDAAIDFDPGKGAPMSVGDTLHGALAGSDLVEAGAKLASKAGAALDAVNRMLDTNLVITLRRTLISTDRLMTYLADAKNGPTAEMGTTLRAFQQTGARLDTAIASVDLKTLQANVNRTMKSADTTTRSVTRLTDQLASTTARLDAIIADIQSGKGTLGKLNSDSMLYHEITQATHALTALITELAKNPGKVGITIRIP